MILFNLLLSAVSARNPPSLPTPLEVDRQRETESEREGERERERERVENRWVGERGGGGGRAGIS